MTKVTGRVYRAGYVNLERRCVGWRAALTGEELVWGHENGPVPLNVVPSLHRMNIPMLAVRLIVALTFTLSLLLNNPFGSMTTFEFTPLWRAVF